MSRALTTSENIYITYVTQPNGTKTPVMSSTPLCDQSVRVNNKNNKAALPLLMGLCLQRGDIDLNESPLMRLVGRVISYRGIPADVWEEILGYNLGLSQDSSDPLAACGHYAVALRRPTLFPQIEMDLTVVVDAAIRGEEKMVLNMISADPSLLLKKATVKNSVDVSYEVTALEAAVMATDVELIEKLKPHFERLKTDLDGSQIDGLAEMHRQIKETYEKSLRAYTEIQVEKARELTSRKDADKKIDDTDIKKAIERHNAYFAALASDDFNEILKAHQQAQADHAFDFQLYVDAITSIDTNNPAQQAELDDVMALIDARTPEETAAVIARTGVAATQTDEARAKPFDQLTLVEKLNRFREELVEHMKKEIIFNPEHILAGLKRNEHVWDDVVDRSIADPRYKKRSVIFSQLVGGAQRKASEPIRQDIRQGIYFLIRKNERRTRPPRFNMDLSARNSFADASLATPSVIDGVGYKFGVGPCSYCPNWATTNTSLTDFQNFCQAKTSNLEGLCSRSRVDNAL